MEQVSKSVHLGPILLSEKNRLDNFFLNFIYLNIASHLHVNIKKKKKIGSWMSTPPPPHTHTKKHTHTHKIRPQIGKNAIASV